MHPSISAHSERHSPLATTALLVASLLGCGGGGGTTQPPVGAFTLSASGSALTIARNGNGTLTMTIARSGGFTGAVSLSTSGLPSGVTASFNPAQVASAQGSSVLTLTAASGAATGTSTVTVTATSSGLANQTATFQLTITTPTVSGPFTLSSSATSFLVYPTTQLTTNPVITITRNAGFTGPVTFSVSGLPATLFLGFTPSPTTGNLVNALILNLGAPNGTYTATIKGSSAQGDQTVTLQVVVAAATTGSIKWKWCTASLPRYFVAVRDGNGAWTRVMPAADTSYNFNISSGTGSLAEVTNDSGGFRTTIYQYTAQEMAARGPGQCALVQHASTRTVNGTFGGVTGFRTSQAGMGWWFGSANGNGNFGFVNLPAGPLDLVAVRNGEILNVSAIPVDRMIIRRGLNPASGSTLPVVDFGAAESFAPTVSTWTFGNLNGESFGLSQMFTTAGGSTGIFTAIPAADGAAAARTVYGVPLANTVAGDLHQVIATVATVGPFGGSPQRALRQVIAYSRTIADRALNFGPAMPAATVSAVAPGRLRAQGTLPTEYNTGVSFDITQTTTATFATIHASRGFLGAGSTYDIQFPDLAAVTGWDTRYGLRPGVATNWWVSGGGPTLDFFDGRYIFNSTRSRWTGTQTGITAPVDGATYFMARVLGVTTP